MISDQLVYSALRKLGMDEGIAWFCSEVVGDIFDGQHCEKDELGLAYEKISSFIPAPDFLFEPPSEQNISYVVYLNDEGISSIRIPVGKGIDFLRPLTFDSEEQALREAKERSVMFNAVYAPACLVQGYFTQQGCYDCDKKSGWNDPSWELI